jgi:hypothetical protein
MVASERLTQEIRQQKYFFVLIRQGKIDVMHHMSLLSWVNKLLSNM